MTVLICQASETATIMILGDTRKMSRDFPGFLHVSRDFPCLPGISNAFPEALSFLAKECPPPNTHKNVEVLVLSVCTADEPGPKPHASNLSQNASKCLGQPLSQLPLTLEL